MLFVLCHMGEMIVSCYEIRQRLANSEEDEDVDFPEWVRNLIVINHILIVANSSLNFAIYCKVQFRFFGNSGDSLVRPRGFLHLLNGRRTFLYDFGLLNCTYSIQTLGLYSSH